LNLSHVSQRGSSDPWEKVAMDPDESGQRKEPCNDVFYHLFPSVEAFV